MTRVERRLAIRTGALGIALALVVVALDYSDVLVALERWCYDRRARYCQFYTPPPSEQFVHVDIDDPTLKTIGHWPWTGTTLSELVDEICMAKPKVVTFDVFWSERQDKQPITAKGADGKETVTGYRDHDANFAAAIARCGNAILPASLGTAHYLPLQREVTGILVRDLELTQAEVIEALRKQGIVGESVAPQVTACFIEALKDAMFTRVKQEMSTQPIPEPALAAKLLPKHTDQFAALRRELDGALLQIEALEQVHKLTRHDVNVPVYPVETELASLPELSAAAKATAFVDYFTESDGVVRAVPMWVGTGSNVYPQMGLAAACAMLGIDPRDPTRVVMAEDSVTLLPPQGNKIVIPLSTMHSRELGRLPGMLEIPWRGPSGSKERRDWERMYDDAKSPHHVVMRDVYEIVLTRRAIEANVEQVDEALKAVMQNLGDKRLKDYVAHPPANTDIAARVNVARDLQKQMRDDPILSTYVGKTPEQFTDEKEKVLAASSSAVDQFTQLDEQLKHQRDNLAPKLKDKAVFIGSVATAMSDFVPTSLHARCPGVVIHGLIFNGIMTGELWRKAPMWVTLLATFIAGILTTAAVAFLSPWKSTLAAALGLAGYLALNGIFLFDAKNIIVGLAGPIIAVGAVWAPCTLYRLLVEQRERARVTSRFRTYVDPTLVNFCLENPQRANFDGELRELTVVYTDLAGFTTISQRLGERVVPIFNDYFDLMVPIIKAHNGLLNKFLGDGIMFFFGSPYDTPAHAAQAVETILEMQKAMPAFNEDLKQQGLPPLIVRAGVSTGEMIVGDAGSKARSDYTVLGDYSNLGARLESANKAVGTSNLLSVRTVELMGDGFIVRPIGRLIVVGRDTFIMTYEALGRKHEATDRHRKLVAMTEKMVHAYFEGRFNQCLEAIDEMEAAFGPDKLTDIYREWATKHLHGVPAEEFAGQIILESK